MEIITPGKTLTQPIKLRLVDLKNEVVFFAKSLEQFKTNCRKARFSFMDTPVFKSAPHLPLVLHVADGDRWLNISGHRSVNGQQVFRDGNDWDDLWARTVKTFNGIAALDSFIGNVEEMIADSETETRNTAALAARNEFKLVGRNDKNQ